MERREASRNPGISMSALCSRIPLRSMRATEFLRRRWFGVAVLQNRASIVKSPSVLNRVRS
jgi:hypothetical protein